MTPLDPLGLELRGVRLIEASAGTGKTHTIATLFVRLVLERKLSVDRILVVTFTNAATAELRDRIRKRLRETLAAFEHEEDATDPVLRALVRKSAHRKGDQKRLATALARVDEAGVLTIHGFCQRVLAEHAFDSGLRTDLALVPDIEPIVADVVHDFVRTRLLDASHPRIEYARSHGLGAADLRALGVVAARLPDANVVSGSRPAGSEDAALGVYFEALGRVKKEWAESRSVVRKVLFESEALARNRYALPTCEKIVAAMDSLASTDDGSFAGWFDGVAKLSTDSLAVGTKKKQTTPVHALFPMVSHLLTAREEAEAALAVWAQGFQGDLVEHVRKELPHRTRERSVQSFDDVLHGLRDALRGARGRSLAAAVRRRFPAALIDEFHDTDPVQYEIFRKIYTARGTSLFLIGDPKQAIYGFRGADVFAYLAAAKDADSRSTLGTNYRSDETLVRAVNTVFSRTDAPFLIDAIKFEQVGTPASATDRLFSSGAKVSGLDVLFVPRQTEEGRRGGGAPTEGIVPGIVAAEVARLLAPGSGASLAPREPGGRRRPVEPHDFAVLTRKNSEAHDVQRALRSLNIPSVLHGDTSVLDTDEATDLALVLKALADPANATSVRSALSTSLLGLTASELFDLGNDEEAWESFTNDFSRWHALWKERGFLPAVRRMLGDVRATARLLATVGGERKLTNFLHLTELCHRQSMDRHLGIAGLLSWFGEVRHDEESREGLAAEAQQIRLESDARAVQLTTMHRSKGLEYPIVMLPYLWRSAGLFKRDEKRLRYHDPDRNHALVLDLRAVDDKTDAIAFAEQEALAEGLRLTYVGLTRARHRAIVLWGAFSGWHDSALARLFHPSIAFGVGKDALDDAAMSRDLDALAKDADGAITVRRVDASPANPYRPQEDVVTDLHARVARRRLSTSFRTSSFSALSSAAPALESAEPERDVDANTAEAAEDASPDETPVLLDGFPKGPRAGDALHSILELADFERRDAEELPRLVRDRLGRQGFDAERWTLPVTEALSDVFETPLTPDSGLTLSAIPLRRRLSELEFTFPAAGARGRRSGATVTAPGIARVFFEREGNGIPKGYGERVAALGFAPLSGFLRGFIDLVFEHEGRFYVADYKSNHLGGAPSRYAAKALAEPMAHHHYFLQSHLYLVALHRYLGARLPNYEYDRHMGGAAYLFLRGMTKERGATTGVFLDLPPKDTILELSSILDAGGVRPRRKS